MRFQNIWLSPIPFTIYFNANAFVAEIGAGGTNLIYSTYLGGTNFDWGREHRRGQRQLCLCDRFYRLDEFPEHKCVPNIPEWRGNQPEWKLRRFCRQIQPSFANLVYSTFLGGTNNDMAYYIAADNSGARLCDWLDGFHQFPQHRHELPICTMA